MSSRLSPPPWSTVWDVKRSVEQANPDFPHIDISAPDFDVFAYATRVRALLRDVGVPTGSCAITWDHLNCRVPVEPSQNAISTLGSGVQAAMSSAKHVLKSTVRPSDSVAFSGVDIDSHSEIDEGAVLSNASGYLKPGQMCLVLGQSGSGTSLLLSRIAGRALPRMIDTKSEDGTDAVKYHHPEESPTDDNGSNITKEDTPTARPVHIVNYVGQPDEHVAELTVRQTLDFAAACKWPAWTPFAPVLRNHDVTLTARALGIEHALDTIVGSTVLRGVSGGERRRVSIGEMCIGLSAVGGSGGGSGTVMVLDNWSKGLDSTTTLSIATGLRGYADRVDGAVVASMQAPGPEVFELFDTLCVLHEGKTVYFGPTQEAERYFNGIGFKRPQHRTTPDFLATVVDPAFRHEYVNHGGRYTTASSRNIDDVEEDEQRSTNVNDTITRAEQTPPETAEEFAAAFDCSAYADAMHQEIANLKRRSPGTTVGATANVTPATTPVQKRLMKPVLQNASSQLRALMCRQLQHVYAKRRALLQELMQSVLFGILLGSMFWQLPSTLGGADSRGGAVFLALMFIAIGALGKVAERFEEKGVFLKQRDAGFFRAWTFMLTQVITFDILIEFFKAACLFIPMYFMAGLNVGTYGQRLFYSILVATMLSAIMMTLSRVFVALSDDADASQGLVSLVVVFSVLYAGFLKNGSDLQGYVVWIYWMNPMHFGLEAVLLNEFVGLSFDCAPDEYIPRGVDIIDEKYANMKFCPKKEMFDTGVNYLKTFRGITMNKDFRIYYFVVLAGFYVGIFILATFATALSRPRGHARKASPGEARRDDKQREQPQPQHYDKDVTLNKKEQDQSMTIDLSSSTVRDAYTGNGKNNGAGPPRSTRTTTFTFSDITYAVDGGAKVLLPGVTGNAVGGRLTLLLGTSGAGKTTLLDVCAFRKTGGRGIVFGGEIRLNGSLVTAKQLSRRAGYCEQNDMHFGGATVFEAVQFAARLRLSARLRQSERNARVFEVLDLLGLSRHKQTQVAQLGSGELKLLTIALEVVTDPEVLFLDEPTSGLSSAAALRVVTALRNIANKDGTAIVCTLHQPSKEVFALCDRVLLLRRGGRTVYFGDIGREAMVVRGYFERNGAAPMRQGENAAAWMLDVVADDAVDWPEKWLDSDERRLRSEETDDLAMPKGGMWTGVKGRRKSNKKGSVSVDVSFGASASISMDNSMHSIKKQPQQLQQQVVADGADASGDERRDNTSGAARVSLLMQIREVVHRQFVLHWRMPEYNGTRVLLALVVALLVGLLYLREIGTDQRGFSFAFAALFLTLIPAQIAGMNVIPPTMAGRDVFYRETSSGTYRPVAYHVAVGLAETPYTVFSAVLFSAVFYFMIGLDASRFGYFVIALTLAYTMAVMFGVMLAATLPTALMAATMQNAIFSLLMVLSGFFIRKSQMPVWWRWTTWANPLSYYLGAVIVNEFDGKTFTCKEGERVPFGRPDGVDSCEELASWMRDDDTGCSFCPTPDGQSVIDLYGADEVDKWVSLAAIAAAIVVCKMAAAYGFTQKRFLSR